MTQYSSDKIKVLSFIAIILVLYIHSDFHDYPNEILGMEFNHYLQDIITGKLGRCAVPLFFMISGFLFFQHVVTLKDIFVKIKKRVKTLLIPYIIAALFFPLFLFLIEYIPFATKMSNGVSIVTEFQEPIGDLFYGIFISKDGSISPWAFHLWYLRDLIIIVIFSPLLFLLKKWLKSETVCLVFLILSFVNIPVVQFSSFFWFMIGETFLAKIDKIQSWGWAIVYIVISTFEMVLAYDCFTYMKIPFTFIGVVAMWSMYNLLVKKPFSLNKHHYIAIACSFTFFIYLFHEPTLNIVRKLLIVILGRTSLGFAINYLVSPWIFAIGFIFIGNLLKKYTPRLFSICVGGR